MKEAPTKIAISTFVTLKCNVCKKTLSCFKEYDKFEVTKNACQFCGDAQVKINYPPNESPLPMQANQHMGCIYCDKVVRSLIEFPSNLEREEPNTTPIVNANPLVEPTKPVSKPLGEGTPIIIISKKKSKRGKK